MITGELRSKIDRLWDAFWSGGISNPLEVIEQITYLNRIAVGPYVAPHRGHAEVVVRILAHHSSRGPNVRRVEADSRRY